MSDISTEPIPSLLPPAESTDSPMRKVIEEVNEVKALTGRDPERLMSESGRDFEELFGLNRAMKSIKQLVYENPKMEEILRNNKITFADEQIEMSFDNLWLKMCQIRKEIRSKNSNFNRDQIDYELLRETLTTYFPGTPIPQIEYLQTHQDDRVLNIGDPFQRLNMDIDEERITTIDYETGEEAGVNKTRVVADITNSLERSYGDGYSNSGYFDAISELESVDRDYDLSPNGKYDASWLWGYDNENGEHIPGLDDLVIDAVAATQEMAKTPTHELVQAAGDKWKRVREKAWERKEHYLQQGRDITKIDYDTSFGLHPIDIISKSVYYMYKAGVDGCAVLDYYQQAVYPPIIHEYIEELADLHVENVHGKTPEEYGIAHYKSEWRVFLQQKGFDPDSYDPYSTDAKFVDTLTEFFLLRGTQMIKYLHPELYKAIQESEKNAINLAFPTKVKSKESKFIRAMFPFTQALPQEGYDRIVASWSISPYLFPVLTDGEFVDLIWKELDRLLAVNGRAVIFPLGHYGDDPKVVADTLAKYNQKYGGSLEVIMDHGERWLSPPEDPSDASVAEIRKTGRPTNNFTPLKT